MFDKYGRLDHQGLIKKAVELKDKREELKALCVENGIPEVMGQLYADGEIDSIGDECTTAIGKIEVEAADMKPVEIMSDWVEYIKQMAFEDKTIAMQIRNTDKSLKGCIAHILMWSFKNSYTVDKDIVKAAVGHNMQVKMGIPGMAMVKKLIKEYYGGQ